MTKPVKERVWGSVGVPAFRVAQLQNDVEWFRLKQGLSQHAGQRGSLESSGHQAHLPSTRD